MKITRNQKREAELMARIQPGRLEGVHLTAVLGCLRKAQYDLTAPKPVTDRMKLYWLCGNSFQDSFLERNDQCLEIKIDTKYGQKTIVCTPDSIEERAEFKSVRTSIRGHIKEDYFRQMIMYCICIGLDEFNLDQLHIASPYFKIKDAPPYVPDDEKAPVLLCYHITEITEDDKQEVWDYVETRGQMLFEAVEEGYPAPKDEGWQCKECQYFIDCELCEGDF